MSADGVRSGRRKPRGGVGLALGVWLALAGCTETIPRGGTFEPVRPLPPHPSTGAAVRMVWPVPGAIASPFRPRSRPNHQGVDLAAPPGTPVVAARDGRVSFVGRIPGYGNVVAIEHGGMLTTVYSHLDDAPTAAVEDRVAAGEAIGRLGSGGYLHFEIRREKTAVDPAGFYAEAPLAAAQAPEVRTDVSREPLEQVPLERRSGPIEVASLPPSAATPAPTAESPRAAATPRDVATPRAVIAATPAPAPEPVPTPREAVAPVPPPAPEPAPEPAPVEGAGTLGGEGEGPGQASLIAGLVVANVVYMPLKLGYAAAGGIVGAAAYGLTGGAVTDVWDAALGGDFYIDAEHLRGERVIRFSGSAPGAG